MLPTENKRLVLASRPPKGPIQSDTFRTEKVSIPSLKDGHVLVRVDWVSIDPTMRNWLNDARSYLPPVKIGEVMRATGIGRVLESKSDKFKAGNLVYGMFGWQEYWVGSAKDIGRREVPTGGQEIDHLGYLGTSGLTAYFGMFDIGRLKDGDTVVVSGAAGSVGLIATQIALAHPKCKVVAIAGSKAKCDDLSSMGCHVVLNYKDKDFVRNLRKVGLVDVYFDNVGGSVLDAVLAQLNNYARVVMCGAIAAYNAKTPPAVYNTPALVSTRSTMAGFIILDYATRYPEGRAYLAKLKASGKLQYKYHLLCERGLEDCVGALGDVFEGKNDGKTLVKVSRDENRSKL